jgi:hypothetical protein
MRFDDRGFARKHKQVGRLQAVAARAIVSMQMADNAAA